MQILRRLLRDFRRPRPTASRDFLPEKNTLSFCAGLKIANGKPAHFARYLDALGFPARIANMRRPRASRPCGRLQYRPTSGEWRLRPHEHKASVDCRLPGKDGAPLGACEFTRSSNPATIIMGDDLSELAICRPWPTRCTEWKMQFRNPCANRKLYMPTGKINTPANVLHYLNVRIWWGICL